MIDEESINNCNNYKFFSTVKTVEMSGDTLTFQ